MRLLPKYMATSEERAAWMKQLREDCDEAGLLLGTRRHLSDVALLEERRDVDNDKQEGSAAAPLYAVPYTYMMIFYESDLGILSSVLINMLSAGIAMLLVRRSKLLCGIPRNEKWELLCAHSCEQAGFLFNPSRCSNATRTSEDTYVPSS